MWSKRLATSRGVTIVMLALVAAGCESSATKQKLAQLTTVSAEKDSLLALMGENTKLMSERDLRAMYRYIKSLGPKANGVPRALAPGKEPTGPYIWVEPRTGS